MSTTPNPSLKRRGTGEPPEVICSPPYEGGDTGEVMVPPYPVFIVILKNPTPPVSSPL